MSNQAVPLLRQFLQQQADRGITHVGLTREALAKLPSLGTRKRQRTQAAPPAADTPIQQPSQTALALSHEGSETDSSQKDLAAARELPGNSREEKLAHLAALAENCQAARALGTLRGTMVFAVGNPHADIMFIGEAPGAEEERQREPFVGPAGQKLTGIIQAMGLKRSDVYISNICKFRPAKENQGNGNRAPTAEEMQSCLPFILAEIEIVQPKVIVALGATACAGLSIEGSVGRNRGRYHSVNGVPVVVTYHPSFLLRQERESSDGGLSTKRECWEDMLLAMEKAGLSISDKQRNYFRSRA